MFLSFDLVLSLSILRTLTWDRALPSYRLHAGWWMHRMCLGLAILRTLTWDRALPSTLSLLETCVSMDSGP